MELTRTRRVDRKRMGRLLLLVAVFTVVWVVASVSISASLLRQFGVSGDSMNPTLRDGERLAVFLPGEPGLRDVVILDAPPQANSPPGSTFIKRIVAVGGDVVSCCSDGHLVVNGVQVAESFIPTSQPHFAAVQVPRGDVFVLGDNRMDSADSRNWGPVPRALVIGQVVVRGPAALALSPLVVGGLVALVCTLVVWIAWRRLGRSPQSDPSIVRGR